LTTFDTHTGTVPTARSDAGFLKELAEKVLRRCEMLATCSDETGMISRTFMSSAMARCNAMTAEWMQAAGMQVSLDEAANLRGIYPGDSADAPRLVIGSHLDTVPDAGRYDGVLGVMIGLALVESLDGRPLPFSIEVIGFSDEEGTRFGVPFIGSRAIVGTLDQAMLASVDAAGVTIDAALDDFNRSYSRTVSARLNAASRAYLEFHIEQGPVLDEAQQGLSAVHAITGQSRATLTFSGKAGHAGTTPMALRRDAMMAAAEWMLHVESIAKTTPGIVATTGRVQCEPGATNIIPGLVRCSLDLRALDDTLRFRSFVDSLDAAHGICERRGVSVEHTVELEQATVPLHASLTRLVQRCVVTAGGVSSLMCSGAGHDAMIIAPHLPAAMIFLRSPMGISHNPAETVTSDDVAAAMRAGMQFLEDFPKWLEENEAAQ
jgi:allantoate deiminase